MKYGRDTLTYSHGDAYLVTSIEHLGTPYEMVVYLNMAGEWMKKGTPTGKPSQSDLDVVEQRIFDSLNYLHRNHSIMR